MERECNLCCKNKILPTWKSVAYKIILLNWNKNTFLDKQTLSGFVASRPCFARNTKRNSLERRKIILIRILHKEKRSVKKGIRDVKKSLLFVAPVWTSTSFFFHSYNRDNRVFHYDTPSIYTVTHPYSQGIRETKICECSSFFYAWCMVFRYTYTESFLVIPKKM